MSKSVAALLTAGALPVDSEIGSWSKALFGYILRTSWPHQLAILILTTIVFLLEVVPLEAQRRVVNDIVKHRPYSTILLLCAGYFGSVVFQGGTKLGLNIYRSWIGERAKRDLRRRISASTRMNKASLLSPDVQGVAVSMVVAEVEPVGNFVGSSISEPLLQTGILATVIAYMVHLDPWMGAAALFLFFPQFVFVPLMQHGMNRRTGMRVRLLRQIGVGLIARGGSGAAAEQGEARCIERVFHVDMGIFELKFTMNFLMNLCSHLQIIAALLLGGWRVLQGELEIGGIVAFISGVGRLNDPWGDLVNYFRTLNLSLVQFHLIVTALDQISEIKVFPSVRADRADASRSPTSIG